MQSFIQSQVRFDHVINANVLATTDEMASDLRDRKFVGDVAQEATLRILSALMVAGQLSQGFDVIAVRDALTGLKYEGAPHA